MKIIYFVQYFPPEKASGLSLVQDLLDGFVNAGWKIVVYTPTPTRGVDNSTRKKICKEKKKEILYGGHLCISRLSLYREGKGVASRALRYMIFSAKCFWKGLLEPGEIIFSGSGPPTQGVIGGMISKFTKKKFVYNLQDVFPDSLSNAKICTKKSILYKLGRKIENFTYKNADLIITISEDMRENILRKGVKPEKICLIRNWVDTEKIFPISRKDNSLFDELHLERDKFYVTYAGNLGYAQGIEYIVETARLLENNSDINFIIFGNGSEEEKIKNLIQKYKLNNILLFPLQAAELISEVYSLGDLSIVSCRPGVGQAGMPSKTWSIMATGTGIIGFFDKNSELERILKESSAGICVQAGKIEELKKQIIYLSENRSLCIQYGENAREYAVKFASKKSALKKYVEAIQNMRS